MKADGVNLYPLDFYRLVLKQRDITIRDYFNRQMFSNNPIINITDNIWIEFEDEFEDDLDDEFGKWP